MKRMDQSGQVVIITQYELPEWKRNMNQYQRVFHGSKYCDVVLLVRRGAEVSEEIRRRVKVIEAPVCHKGAFLAYCTLLALRLRSMGCRLILTDPSVFSVVGLFAKFLGRYFWSIDIWDPPRRRLGRFGERLPATAVDRLVFWMMSQADFFVISGLKEQAPTIRLPEGRWEEFLNAIDLRDIANSPPERNADDPLLQVSIARSVLHEESGIREIVEAAEKLSDQGCPVKIHLLGKLAEATERWIKASRAASSFETHGFISMSRTEFFRKMHAGLVPYRATEDLNYIYPIKVMEHLSQGNPVIASRLPGLSRMVQHGYNGLLVEPGNGSGFAEAMAKLQGDFDFWRRLSQNAIDSSRKYDAAEKNRRIFQLLQRQSNGGQSHKITH